MHTVIRYTSVWFNRSVEGWSPLSPSDRAHSRANHAPDTIVSVRDSV